MQRDYVMRLVETLTEEDQAVYRPKLRELATRLRSLLMHPYLGAKLAEYDARPGA